MRNERVINNSLYKRLSIDEGFPRRIFNTSLILSIIIILLSIGRASYRVTIGLAIGMGISLVLFVVLWSTVDRFLLMGKKKGGFIFFIIGLSKYFILGGVLFFIFRYSQANPLSLLIGISLVHIVIILKVAGIGMVNYVNRTVRS